MKNTLSIFLLIPLCFLLLSACGAKQEPKPVTNTAEASPSNPSVETAAETQESEKQIKPAPAKMAESIEVTEEVLNLGARSFIRCRSCHTLGLEEPHTVGPNLYGLFGSAAGKREGYNYSEALASSDRVWDVSTLKQWLKSPATYIPGNKMAFAGVANDKELDALLAYLNKSTQ